MKLLRVFLCASLVLATAVHAQIVDPQNVLIKNVYLVAGGDATEGIAVNLLITDNVLEIVTKDEVPIEEAAMAVDARGGFLFGQLKVGETPSFIVLNQDPRDNFDVLLDTDFYTIFAVHDGRLFRNNLFEVQEEELVEEAEKTRASWLAYTPPPMMLPLNYGDSSKWNQWETENTTGMFIAAVVLDRQHWLSQSSGSIQQVGDLEDFEGGEIRGFRLGAVGTLNYFDKPWIYTVFAATNAFDKGFEREELDSLAFFDYRLDVPLGGMNLSVGKQKEPISMERIMSMVQLPMQERTSVSDALLPSRNFGAVLSGTAMDQRMSWAGGLFNNFIDSDESFSDTASQAVGRVTWLPFVSADESNLVHLGFGARYSSGKQGARFATEPEYNKAPDFVNTGSRRIDADDIWTYNLEASWRKGPYWLHAEYIDTQVDSPSSGDLNFGGYHITGSWIISGEMREYRRSSGILGPIPVSRSVYQGGWGAWELSARWSSLDLADGPIDGGEMDILSLGLNWWLSPIFNVNMNYRYIENDVGGISGDASGFMTRIMLSLE
jgi:phosphate-selective porin OprO/OprP